MEPPKGELLIRLLDDPDQVVYEAVSQKIQQMGAEILPDLESAAREAMSPVLHERIESIIRILQFDQLKKEISLWMSEPFPQLMDGAWLMTRYQFPDFSRRDFTLMLKPIRDEIWLEISESLTALEKVRIINTFLFKNSRILMNDDHPESPGNNYINRVIETGYANEHSLNLLYAILGQELGMPLFVADMPGYPILAYIDMPMNKIEKANPGFYEVLFYINPADSGSVHSRNDITNYLIRQDLPLKPAFYLPRANSEFIRLCLKKLAQDYEQAGSKKRSLHIQDLLNLWKY